MENDQNSPRSESKVLPKRFYEEVSCRQNERGYEILLDGRVVKTPLKKPLNAPNEIIANALVAEWEAQKDVIDAASMFLTKMLNTSIDHVSDQKKPIIDEMVKYAGTDMLCYRASEPESLVSAQQKKWDPVLAWLKEKYGVELKIAEGIIHQTQDEEDLQKIRQYLLGKSDYFIAGFHALATLSGSVVIAMACGDGKISVEEAWECAHLDANWQSERWGVDEEAEIAKKNAFKEFQTAVFLIENIS